MTDDTARPAARHPQQFSPQDRHAALAERRRRQADHDQAAWPRIAELRDQGTQLAPDLPHPGGRRHPDTQRPQPLAARPGAAHRPAPSATARPALKPARPLPAMASPVSYILTLHRALRLSTPATSARIVNRPCPVLQPPKPPRLPRTDPAKARHTTTAARHVVLVRLQRLPAFGQVRAVIVERRPGFDLVDGIFDNPVRVWR